VPNQYSQELIGWTKQEHEEALRKVKQPYYDFEIAKICVWLKQHGLTMHVTLRGDVAFKRKGTDEIVNL
jgi:hypothetical protein